MADAILRISGVVCFLSCFYHCFFFFSFLLPTGLLSLKLHFPSIYDIDGCASTAVSLISGWVFHLETTGWIFFIRMCENSINQSINKKIAAA